MSAFSIESAYAETYGRTLAEIPVELLEALEPISEGYPISGDALATYRNKEN